MFKVVSQLTNVRPTKNEPPKLITSPSEGMIKINAPAAMAMAIGVKDFAAIVVAEKENGEQGIFIRKGAKADSVAKTPQVGSVLSSHSGTGGGTLQFGSTNAWEQLGGNKDKLRHFDVNITPIESDGVKYYELTFNNETDKTVRAAKGEGKAAKAKKAAEENQA